MDTTKELSEEERVVLETFKRLGRTIGEDEYHMIQQTMDFAGKGLGFEYELSYWEHIDERFKSNSGAVPYSSKLHNIINGLEEKGFLERDKQNLINMRYLGN